MDATEAPGTAQVKEKPAKKKVRETHVGDATKFWVKLRFIEMLLGSAPLDPELYKKYIEDLKRKRVERGEITLPEGEQPEAETVPEEKGTGFHRDETGLFLYDYAIKGMFKECGNVLRQFLGIEALRSKLDNYLFVTPRRCYLMTPEGNPIKEPNGVLERPIRVMTPQGFRVALAASEFVNPGATLAFDLLFYKGHPFKEPLTLVKEVLEYTKTKGFGQWRNGGYGKCEYTIEPR